MIHPLVIVAERLQLTRPLVSLDVETTGTALGVDRIIQFGVQKVALVPGPAHAAREYQVTEWMTFIDPQMAIPPGATLTHKITNDMVAGSPTFKTLSTQLALRLTDVDFAGQNVKFDLRFLEAEFKRCGVTWSYDGASILDTKRLDEIFYPRTLDVLYEKYCRKALENAHDAMADVRATSEILAEQITCFEGLAGAAAPGTIEGFHALLFPRDPSWVDQNGKIVWRNHDACFGFGKWNGVPLKSVPKDYLSWCLGQDFPQDMKGILRDALNNRFPVQAVMQEAA